ncbi:hypothetical protein CKF54_03075 [Psittacicella hinzii]|uniref:ATP-dependent RNA helicase SrmB n=1 Tax=Psittacicella hinzii TaxID=2028575 RepID=A0A3A1YAN7_9GAMM|nr:DEAD/DEAH box helicase [Psittacicella hinzii]RIY33187.1 hypothetical protein CKF54_03075 [Psittacicella hinzii]
MVNVQDIISSVTKEEKDEKNSSLSTAKKKKKFKQPKLDKKLLELVVEKKKEKAKEKAERQALGEVDRDFANFFLPEKLTKNLYANNYFRATDIQAKAISLIVEGNDVLISAETGTGKTLAYLIPAVERLLATPLTKEQKCNVLVVAPTRDLVLQIETLAKQLLANTYYKVATFIGDINNQEGKKSNEEAYEVFANHQLVITTPGRLVKQLSVNGDIDLTGVSLLILDEADRLLEMGAGEDIFKINQHLIGRENTVLVSATLEQKVVDLFSKIALNNPITVKGSHSRAEKNTLTQYYYHADNIEHKKELLASILQEANLDKVIIFVRKADTVQPLTKFLMNRKMGLRATGIYGEMSKEERERALGLFKSGKVNLLVTTDLLARGIDIENVKAVINYDMPYDGATFMHRVGRTARFGKKGIAISLVQAHDYKYLGKAMRFMKVVISAKVFPGLEPTTSVSPDALKGSAKVKIKDKSKKTAKTEKPKVKNRKDRQKNKGYPKKFKEKAL